MYTVVIDELSAKHNVAFAKPDTIVELLVIKDHTSVDRQTNTLSGEVWPESDRVRYARSLSISPETLEDFRRQNRQSHQLHDAFKVRLKHVLAPGDELEPFREERRWEEFYRKYPASGGFISFSGVGFNPEMNQAFVYVEHWCDVWCGSGIYVALKKHEGRWEVTTIDEAWVS